MKKLLISVFCIALLILLPLVAYAHSGRTDSSGGHYDKSTGKYHYHHGYSAHDHFDMDGDGDLDCPYDFDDKTNHNSSDKSTTKKKNQISFWDVVKAILLLIPVSLLTLHTLYIVLSLISILIGWFIEKCFKISIAESKMERILHISMMVGFVILVPLEFICILGIL